MTESEASPIKVYISGVSSNIEIKGHQQRIKMVLESKGIQYESIDITTVSDAKQTMRDGVGDQKALPPQIFRDDKYLGDYAAFHEAVEDGKLLEFLNPTS